MNEEQEKEILNEAKIQTARHKKKIQIISLVAIIAVIAMAIAVSYTHLTLPTKA